MSEASDMTELKNLQDGLDTRVKFNIIMIADRGYVSEENITEMRNAGLGFILMFRRTWESMKSLMPMSACFLA